ncbi:hypothetical protein RvY_01187-2 [Ramazzottius varieornatus]|uniref:Rho guanine nucleotide exchange factor 11 n=1 Tax=Ramazzottius varieornatus TaxID=947166 RepID=A0A1D1UJ01_RAMVA|nr:hypothetical protein RvY_01187-2 [Ramazzottius varieornatus]
MYTYAPIMTWFSHLTGKADNQQNGLRRGKDPPAVLPIKPLIASGLTESDEGLVQRFVVFQRDEKGYGLTVSGDNPVFVQSIKKGGPAYCAGVQKGDRIIKVNEVLVTQSNHTEVVRLIKANNFVALTLLGKVAPKTADPSRDGGGGGDPPPVPPPFENAVNGPKSPGEPERQVLFIDSRIQTMNLMREQEMQRISQLTKEFTINPTETLQADLDVALKRVKQLQEQIFVLSMRRNAVGSTPSSPTGGPNKPLRPTVSSFADRPLPALPVENVVPPAAGRVSRRSSTVSNHARQLSTPEPLAIAAAQLSLPSDTSAFNHSMGSLPTNVGPEIAADLTANAKKPPDGRHRTSSFGEKTFGRLGLPPPFFSAALAGASSGGASRHSRTLSSSGLSSFLGHGSQVEATTREDSSFDGPPQRPFSSYLVLQRHIPHLATFIHYVISNAEPSSLLFHVLTEHYAKGTSKELQRWAYELLSTFLVPGAPLEIEAVKHTPSLVSHVDDLLEKGDEGQLRDMFNSVRNRSVDTIKTQLTEFQHRRSLGHSPLLGPSDAELDEAEKSVDKTKSIVGDILGKTVESITVANPEDPENRADRQAAIGCVVASLMKLYGVKTKDRSDGTPIIDRWPLLLQKDKNKYKLRDRTKKAVSISNHQFSHMMSTLVLPCNHCKEILWGCAPQGYQCAFCDYVVHRGCAKKVEEICVGKKSRTLEDFFGFRKRSNQSPAAITAAKRLHDEKENSPALSTTDSLFTSDSSSIGRLTHIPSSNQLDSGRSSPSIVRSESLRAAARKPPTEEGNKRKKSDSTSLDEVGDKQNGRLVGTSESSSGSTTSIPKSESPNTSTEVLALAEKDSDFEADPDNIPSWQAYLPNPQLFEKLDARNRKRQEVIAELFHTERTHVRNLKVLRMVFYIPMTRDNVLPPELASQVFANLDEMISMHNELNRGMRAMRKSRPLIGNVGNLLLSRFDGEAGHRFKMAAAAFCRNQTAGLEALKLRQKKDQRLAQFLAEAEANPLCRRLQLKDLLPTGMQRMTKYPLLLESLLKYTSTEQDDDREYEKVVIALNGSKEILDFVNQAVKESANFNRLRDLQDKIDMSHYKKVHNKMGIPYKPLDLLDYRLFLDGDLTWRISKQKSIDLRVLLLNKRLVFLTRQDDKLLLRFHTNPTAADKRGPGEYNRYWWPVLNLDGMKVQEVAGDPRAFFLIAQSDFGPQMYELGTATAGQQRHWMQEIRAAVDGLSGTLEIMNHFPVTATLSVTSSSPSITDSESPDIETEGLSGDELEEGNGNEGEGTTTSPFERTKAEHRLKKAALTSPSAVVVVKFEIMDTLTIVTPYEQVRRSDNKLEEALRDKKRLVSDILRISPDRPPGGISVASSKEPTPEPVSQTTSQTDPKGLILEALENVQSLTAMVTSSLNTTVPATSARMVSEVESCEAVNGRCDTAVQTKILVPLLDVFQLEDLTLSLNRRLSALMTAVCLREDENARLRKDLLHTKDQLGILRREKRSLTPDVVPLNPQSGPEPT